MDGLLTIGRFAQRTGLTIKALRLYDQRGLLRPATIDLHTGYRYYSPDQVEAALFILLLRGAGMPLVDIAAVVRAQDSDAANRYLARHRERLERDIRHSKDALLLLDRVAQKLKESETVPSNKEYRCSFCGKTKDQIERMIAGPNAVYICNECVDLCNKIIDTARQEAAPTPSA